MSGTQTPTHSAGAGHTARSFLCGGFLCATRSCHKPIQRCSILLHVRNVTVVVFGLLMLRMRMKYLSYAEKESILAEWATRRSDLSAKMDAPGMPDLEVLPLVDYLNSLPGICTVQSCSGHHLTEHMSEGGIKPGLLWIRLDIHAARESNLHIDELLQHREIEAISLLFKRWSGPVVEILFHGKERKAFPTSERILKKFFSKICAGPSI